MSNPPAPIAPGGFQPLPLEQIELLLQENQVLLQAIQERQNLNDVTACVKYQEKLQRNLVSALAYADLCAGALFVSPTPSSYSTISSAAATPRAQARKRTSQVTPSHLTPNQSPPAGARPSPQQAAPGSSGSQEISVPVLPPLT